MNNATLINIGDELLLGQVVNTNASTMSRLLTGAGFEVRRVVTVGDSLDEIKQAIGAAMRESDAVLVTGGLGPTKDDITKQALCEHTGSSLMESPVALENVRRLFALRGFELTPVNRAQALVPECCTVLNNDVGTAPCMWFEQEGRVLVSMPGVPFEMEWLMEHRVLPRLQSHFTTEAIVNKNILVQGIGESFLSDLVEPWELALPPHIRLAYLPQAGMVKMRLTGRSPQAARAELVAEIERQAAALRQMAGQYIVGEDCESLEELVHRTLTRRGLTLATAESCTGGAIASRLTAMAGASAYFMGGVVAYSNEVKESQLGVSQSTLATHGAVSEQTAREMAEGARRRLGADLAIATTGIAGPDGGTEEKPVGTVWIAVSDHSRTEATLLQYAGRQRQQNIERTANQAFSMLMHMLCRED